MCDQQKLYIAPSETEETFDKELLQNDKLLRSAKAVGQLSPIVVAIYPNDPYKDSNSEQRLHLRIIEGRHRYKQDPNWKREYWLIDDFQEYCKLRLNYDIKKRSNPTELKAILRMQGEDLLLKGTPSEKIGSVICKNLEGIHKSQILFHLPPEWKDSRKASNRLGKTKQKNGEHIHEKCLQEIANLKAKIQRLWTENSEMKEHIMNLESERR